LKEQGQKSWIVQQSPVILQTKNSPGVFMHFCFSVLEPIFHSNETKYKDTIRRALRMLRRLGENGVWPSITSPSTFLQQGEIREMVLR
jgi:hypothetical protein